jgi:hypothetical protein
MMGCAGSWAGEVGTGIPWFQAGKVCTPADCTAVNTVFPGQTLALAPEGSGFPSFYNVLVITVRTRVWVWGQGIRAYGTVPFIYMLFCFQNAASRS